METINNITKKAEPFILSYWAIIKKEWTHKIKYTGGGYPYYGEKRADYFTLLDNANITGGKFSKWDRELWDLNKEYSKQLKLLKNDAIQNIPQL